MWFRCLFYSQTCFVHSFLLSSIISDSFQHRKQTPGMLGSHMVTASGEQQKNFSKGIVLLLSSLFCSLQSDFKFCLPCIEDCEN